MGIEWEYWRRFKENRGMSDWYLVEWSDIAERFNDEQIDAMYRGETIWTAFAEYRARPNDRPEPTRAI